MPTDNERARRYRNRAEELRTLSDTWHDDFARDALETLARQYDTLAVRLERGRELLSATGRQSFDSRRHEDACRR